MRSQSNGATATSDQLGKTAGNAGAGDELDVARQDRSARIGPHIDQ